MRKISNEQKTHIRHFFVDCFGSLCYRGFHEKGTHSYLCLHWSSLLSKYLYMKTALSFIVSFYNIFLINYVWFSFHGLSTSTFVLPGISWKRYPQLHVSPLNEFTLQVPLYKISFIVFKISCFFLQYFSNKYIGIMFLFLVCRHQHALVPSAPH